MTETELTKIKKTIAYLISSNEVILKEIEIIRASVDTDKTDYEKFLAEKEFTTSNQVRSISILTEDYVSKNVIAIKSLNKKIKENVIAATLLNNKIPDITLTQDEITAILATISNGEGPIVLGLWDDDSFFEDGTIFDSSSLHGVIVLGMWDDGAEWNDNEVIDAQATKGVLVAGQWDDYAVWNDLFQWKE